MSSTEFGRKPDSSARVPVSVRRAPTRRRRFRLTWRRAIGLAFLVLLIGVAGYGARLGWSIYNFNNEVVRPDPTPFSEEMFVEDTPEPTVAPGMPTHPPRPTRTAGPAITPTPWPTLPPGRVNILLLGTDKRADDPGTTPRSDTIILLSVDTEQQTVGILNIPRDLLMTVPKYGKRKVNAAYAIGEYNNLPGGGAFVAVQTVQRFLSVPIKYYVAINFEGFQKVVDTIGGIYIDVPEEINDPNYPTPWFGTELVHFDAGYQHMNGEEALKYARTRHTDNDFGRNRRQQQVILAIRQQALRMNMLPQLPTLIDDFSGMVETNIPFDTQLAFGQLAAGISASDIYTAQISSRYVYTVPDPQDGSEALALDWDVAQPMLDEFFGRGVAVTSRPGVSLTPLPGTPTVRVAQRTPTPRPQRTPTPRR